MITGLTRGETHGNGAGDIFAPSGLEVGRCSKNSGDY